MGCIYKRGSTWWIKYFRDGWLAEIVEIFLIRHEALGELSHLFGRLVGTAFLSSWPAAP